MRYYPPEGSRVGRSTNSRIRLLVALAMIHHHERRLCLTYSPFTLQSRPFVHTPLDHTRRGKTPHAPRAPSLSSGSDVHVGPHLWCSLTHYVERHSSSIHVRQRLLSGLSRQRFNRPLRSSLSRTALRSLSQQRGALRLRRESTRQRRCFCDAPRTQTFQARRRRSGQSGLRPTYRRQPRIDAPPP